MRELFPSFFMSDRFQVVVKVLLGRGGEGLTLGEMILYVCAFSSTRVQNHGSGGRAARPLNRKSVAPPVCIWKCPWATDWTHTMCPWSVDVDVNRIIVTNRCMNVYVCVNGWMWPEKPYVSASSLTILIDCVFKFSRTVKLMLRSRWHLKPCYFSLLCGGLAAPCLVGYRQMRCCLSAVWWSVNIVWRREQLFVEAISEQNHKLPPQRFHRDRLHLSLFFFFFLITFGFRCQSL